MRSDAIDTTGKTVHSGDAFSVTIPSSLEVFNGTSFTMAAPDGTVVATCNAPAGKGTTLTCTFTSYADTHTDITGSGFLTTTVTEINDNPTVSFTTLNGTITANIPGDKFGARPGRGEPPTTYKFGFQSPNNPDTLTWNVWINENTLNGSANVTVNDVFSNENGGFSFNPGTVALQVWPTTDSWTNGSDPHSHHAGDPGRPECDPDAEHPGYAQRDADSGSLDAFDAGNLQHSDPDGFQHHSGCLSVAVHFFPHHSDDD